MSSSDNGRGSLTEKVNNSSRSIRGKESKSPLDQNDMDFTPIKPYTEVNYEHGE